MSLASSFGDGGINSGNEMYKEFKTVSGYVCNGLFSVMVSEPEELPAFESYLEDIKLLRRSFLNSDIVHVPRTENLSADSLARSARKQPYFVVHMDVELLIWFTESTRVCVYCKKKVMIFVLEILILFRFDIVK